MKQLDMFGDGQEMVDKAEKWIAANPAAWNRMLNMAAGYAAQERRFSIARLAEDVRYEMRLNGVDAFKLNNDIRAALARKLKKYPHISPYIEIRASKVDGLV